MRPVRVFIFWEAASTGCPIARAGEVSQRPVLRDARPDGMGIVSAKRTYARKPQFERRLHDLAEFVIQIARDGAVARAEKAQCQVKVLARSPPRAVQPALKIDKLLDNLIWHVERGE